MPEPVVPIPEILKSKLLGNPEVETNGKSRSLNSIDDVPDSYYSAILSIVLRGCARTGSIVLVSIKVLRMLQNRQLLYYWYGGDGTGGEYGKD